MSIIDKISDKIGYSLFDQGVGQLLRISTGFGNHLYSNEGCRISVIKLLGTLRPQSGDERDYSMQKLEQLLQSWGQDKGHRCSLIYQQDSQGMMRYLKGRHAPIRKSLDRMGINLGFVLDSREHKLKDDLTIEETYLVLETQWSALKKGDSNSKRWNLHPSKDAQSGIESAALDQAHEAMLNRWLTALEDRLSVRYERLDARQAASTIESMWKGYQANPSALRLPGDVPMMQTYDFDASKKNPRFDHRHLLLPTLQHQIMDVPVYFDEKRDDYCIIGDRYYGAARLVGMPTQPATYNEFLRGIPRDIPFRLAFQFDSGQGRAAGIGLRRGLGLLSYLFNPMNNGRIARTAKNIQLLVDAGVVFAPVRMMLTTWGETEQAMRSNMMTIGSAFSGLGNAKIQQVCEGVDRAVAQTLPGSKINGSEIMMPSQLLTQILPLERTESPWSNAVLLTRTEDNKAYPIETGSRIQDFHTYVLVGPPGSGKSTTMTTQLLNGVLLRPGMDSLPEVRYLDIGYTASGPFNYFRSLLPKQRQHEVVHYQLANDKKDTINIFDTPLGADYPPPDEKAGITTFIELLMQDDHGKLPDFVSDIVSLLVDEAYRYAAVINPEIYYKDVEPDIDEALADQGFDFQSQMPTWKEVRDFFFDRDMLHLAELAHLKTMPVWSNLPTYLKDSEAIKNQFADMTIPGSTMPVIEYVRTKIISQGRLYANLGGSSKLHFSSAKMMAIDLQNVATNNRQTEVYYALARFVLVKGWFMEPETVSLIKDLPERYQAYHRKRLKLLRNTDKWLFYDELHRPAQACASGKPDDSRIMQMLMRDNREIRKYRIRLVLGSQSIEHMPSELKNDSMWSLLIIQGARTRKSRERLKELFGITDFGMEALEDRVKGPVPGKGTTVLLLAETKLGRIEQTVVLSPSAAELWAAPSEQQDVSVVKEVNARLADPEKSVIALSKYFPSGSARKEIQKRIDESNGDLTELKVMDQIIDEVVASYLQQQARV